MGRRSGAGLSARASIGRPSVPPDERSPQCDQPHPPTELPVPMKILGIHDGHNASACLLENGVIRAAVQEERLSRLKNHNGFPARAIEWVLSSTGTAPDGLDRVAFNSLHMPYPKTTEQLLKEYDRSQSLGTGLKRLLKRTPARAWHRRRRRASRIADARAAGLPVDRIVFVDHH